MEIQLFYGNAVDLTAYSAVVRLLVIHGCFISFFNINKKGANLNFHTLSTDT